MTNESWVGLDIADFRNMLISLIGYRFGEQPEEHLDEIRAERAAYAASYAKLAGIAPSDTVLDLGSGCGFGTAELARRCRRVIACDISPAYLEFARQECATFDNIEFHRIQSRDLSPIGDQSVDKVISMSVFIHLNLYDMHAYFGEFHRILRPGGKLAFDFSDMNRLFGKFRRTSNDPLFLEHAGYYHKDPSTLPGLLQWNSAGGITGVARSAGFRRTKKRGHKLLFKKSPG